MSHHLKNLQLFRKEIGQFLTPKIFLLGHHLVTIIISQLIGTRPRRW